MKVLVLAALVIAGLASSGFAENAASAALEDPLTAQIRLRQLTQPNGGVTGIRVDPTGKVVKIEVVDFGGAPLAGTATAAPSAGALEGLKPHKGLVKKTAGQAKGKAIEQPKTQLDHIETRRKW